jgi:hypothetical protein
MLFCACRLRNSVRCVVIYFQNSLIVGFLSPIIVTGPMALQNRDPIIIRSVIRSAQLCFFYLIFLLPSKRVLLCEADCEAESAIEANRILNPPVLFFGEYCENSM